jgi:methionyl-tRNA formyltransferase
MKILFLGTGEIGVPSLQAMAEHHQICGVITQPDRPAGRKLQLKPSPIKVAAEVLGLPVFQPEKLRGEDVLETLRSHDADLFFVAAYGQILSRAVLDIPRLGCVNLHVSLLPRHRGASPIHAAILAGDEQTGVTMMFMDEGLDTGDIILQTPIPILPHDTAGSLHDRLARMAPPTVLETLDRLQKGTATRTPQDSASATYAPKILKEQGRIIWSHTAESICRQIRGLNPWPGTFTHLPDGTLLKIHEAHAVASSSLQISGSLAGSQCHVASASSRWSESRYLEKMVLGPAGTVLPPQENAPLIVATGEEALSLDSVQLAGARRLDARTFLQGHPLIPGTVLI